MKITILSELENIEASAVRSAERSLHQFAAVSGRDALKALWRMKVEPTGCDPLNADRPLNLIEQLNQTFTYIASVRAARILFDKHPHAVPFILNLGSATGSDIESKKEGGIAAEVFAAVNTSNNNKLNKDILKVSATDAQFKYVFYMCPGVGEGRQDDRGGVQVWSVGADL